MIEGNFQRSTTFLPVSPLFPVSTLPFEKESFFLINTPFIPKKQDFSASSHSHSRFKTHLPPVSSSLLHALTYIHILKPTFLSFSILLSCCLQPPLIILVFFFLSFFGLYRSGRWERACEKEKGENNEMGILVKKNSIANL